MERRTEMAPTEAVGSRLAGGRERKMEILVESWDLREKAVRKAEALGRRK
jgi:hypothetical protein